MQIQVSAFQELFQKEFIEYLFLVSNPVKVSLGYPPS